MLVGCGMPLRSQRPPDPVHKGCGRSGDAALDPAENCRVSAISCQAGLLRSNEIKSDAGQLVPRLPDQIRNRANVTGYCLGSLRPHEVFTGLDCQSCQEEDMAASQ